MSFINYFSYILFLACTLYQTTNAITLKEQCGKYTYQIEIFYEFELAKIQHKLYRLSKEEKLLFYKTQPGMLLDATCIQNRNNDYLMLFNEQCWGNACNENIYGLYDPNIQKIILDPAKWPNGNIDQVEILLGYKPKYLIEGDTFCCTTQVGQIRHKLDI
ncbi:MAG: hypothetical protein Q8M40_12135 [Legionella sp.]|nr:hypothetical protein [Legionella sp.]